MKKVEVLDDLKCILDHAKEWNYRSNEDISRAILTYFESSRLITRTWDEDLPSVDEYFAELSEETNEKTN